MALFQLPDVAWVCLEEPVVQAKETIVKREAATIGEFRSWSSCTVPQCLNRRKPIFCLDKVLECRYTINKRYTLKSYAQRVRGSGLKKVTLNL